MKWHGGVLPWGNIRRKGSECVPLVITWEVSVNGRCRLTPITRVLAFILTFAWEQRGPSDVGSDLPSRVHGKEEENVWFIISLVLCLKACILWMVDILFNVIKVYWNQVKKMSNSITPNVSRMESNVHQSYLWTVAGTNADVAQSVKSCLEKGRSCSWIKSAIKTQTQNKLIRSGQRLQCESKINPEDIEKRKMLHLYEWTMKQNTFIFTLTSIALQIFTQKVKVVICVLKPARSDDSGSMSSIHSSLCDQSLGYGFVSLWDSTSAPLTITPQKRYGWLSSQPIKNYGPVLSFPSPSDRKNIHEKR